MAIKMEPGELQDLAAKLRSNAEEAISLASTIGSNIATGTAAWEGEAASDYAASFEEIKPTLTEKLPTLIQEMAERLDKTAQKFIEMDQALAGH